MYAANVMSFSVGRYSRAFSVLHNSLAVIGLVALGAAAVFIASYTGEIRDNRPGAIGQIRYAGNLLFDTSPEAENQQQMVLANYLSRRYRVASDATGQLVGVTFEASRQIGLDPLLLLAVIAIESRFNPIAESSFGAKGLMQVIPKMHLDKIDEHGGLQSMLNPMTNIMVGGRILKQYIRQTGSVESGLQVYNGAVSDTTNQYAIKVIAEQERMRQAMRGAKSVLKESAAAI